MSAEKKLSKRESDDSVEEDDDKSNTQVKNFLLAWLDYIMQKPENQKFIKDIREAKKE